MFVNNLVKLKHCQDKSFIYFLGEGDVRLHCHCCGCDFSLDFNRQCPLKIISELILWYAPLVALALGFSFPFTFFFLLLEQSINRNEMFGTAVVLRLLILAIVYAVSTLLKPKVSQRPEV